MSGETEGVVSHHGRKLRHVRRILVVKPSSMGDVVHTFKAVQLLSENYPKAVFDWLIVNDLSGVLDYSPVAIAEKIIFPRRDLGRITTFLPAFFGLLRDLRYHHYDLVVDFQGLLRSALFARMTRCHHVLGFADPREKAARKFYTRCGEISESAVHSIDRNMDLARTYCVDMDLKAPYHVPNNQHNAKLAQRKLEHRHLENRKLLISVFPGARWASKTFPVELFIKLICDIHERYPEAAFLLMGSLHENKAGSQILKQTGKYVHSLIGATKIGEMVELLRRSALVISNDSGPMHFAAALNVPGIAFFGATDPAKTGPVSEAIEVFERTDLPCLHCLKRECSEAAELCHKLPYEEVLSSALKKLESGHAADAAE